MEMLKILKYPFTKKLVTKKVKYSDLLLEDPSWGVQPKSNLNRRSTTMLDLKEN